MIRHPDDVKYAHVFTFLVLSPDTNKTLTWNLCNIKSHHVLKLQPYVYCLIMINKTTNCNFVNLLTLNHTFCNYMVECYAAEIIFVPSFLTNLTWSPILKIFNIDNFPFFREGKKSFWISLWVHPMGTW